MFEHPQKVCMTYYEHFRLSIWFSCKFAEACVKSFIHAVLPCYFIKSTTEITHNVKNILDNSGCNRKKFDYHVQMEM